jgi:hypothetical protein
MVHHRRIINLIMLVDNKLEDILNRAVHLEVIALADFKSHPHRDLLLVLIPSKSRMESGTDTANYPRRLYQWFTAVDSDRSGAISAAELQQALVNGDWTRVYYLESHR